MRGRAGEAEEQLFEGKEKEREIFSIVFSGRGTAGARWVRPLEPHFYMARQPLPTLLSLPAYEHEV
jgi:hypothetical protein